VTSTAMVAGGERGPKDPPKTYHAAYSMHFWQQNTRIGTASASDASRESSADLSNVLPAVTNIFF
jgi:hypothetical protein